MMEMDKRGLFALDLQIGFFASLVELALLIHDV